MSGGFRFSELLIGSLVVVVIYNVLALVDSGDAARWGGTTSKILDHVLNPSKPLIPYPPGHPKRGT